MTAQRLATLEGQVAALVLMGEDVRPVLADVAEVRREVYPQAGRTKGARRPQTRWYVEQLRKHKPPPVSHFPEARSAQT